MDEYIFDTRKQISIINLEITQEHLSVAASKVEDICSKGNKILFVGTKRSASKTIKEEASQIGLPYVDKRWLGGTLTNWKTIRGSIRRLIDIEETHHLKKLDKPSGTAIEIENLIKDEDTLNLISLSKTVSHRIDDISGIHKVIFTDKDVTYTYTHKAISRDIFGNGALYCAKKVIKLQPDLYTFERIIN